MRPMHDIHETQSEAGAHSDPASALIRSRYQWERWRGVQFALIAGATATLVFVWRYHPTWKAPEHWKVLAVAWAGGLVLTALTAALMRRFAPSSLLATARRLDRHYGAMNRFEAAAALQDSASPLARAQRDETAAFLGRAFPAIRPARALPWLSAGVAAVLVAHLSLLAIWAIAPLFHRIFQAPKTPPIVEFPQASITWEFPEPEIRANPVEEVPAEAVANSTTGLKDLVLEVGVNGVAKRPLPLHQEPHEKTGASTIKASLYMDDLEVEPFDVVCYFIRA